jgi:alpha-L-glutamate ligase-like protein
VVKPAQGSGGDGILVITGRSKRKRNMFRRSSGLLISEAEIQHHLSNIISGQYSLSGNPDKALIEYCVHFDPIFAEVSYQGVPDIRVIVYRGYPAMAMVRLPTRASDGKANLHQGGKTQDPAVGLYPGVGGARLRSHRPRLPWRGHGD